MNIAYVTTYITGVNYLNHLHLHPVLKVESKWDYVSSPPYALMVRTVINVTSSVYGGIYTHESI